VKFNHSVHFNDKLFEDPFTFKADRFVDATGRFEPCEHVMTFSVGKRRDVYVL